MLNVEPMISVQPINLFNNIGLVGEDRENTILNNLVTPDRMLKRTGAQTSNLKIRNLTLKSPGNGSPIYLSGATRCEFTNNHFWFSSMPSGPKIMVFLDASK